LKHWLLTWGLLAKSFNSFKQEGYWTYIERMVKRKLLYRSKRPPTHGWRLIDEKCDEFNKTYRFTSEGWCDPLGFNGYRKLDFCSENNSLLDHDISKQSIYCNPPRSLHIKCVEHLRACHAKSSLYTLKQLLFYPIG